MTPILYESIEGTNSHPFVTNGLGGLSDAASCVVTEERNGSFELEMTYPTDGIHFSDIKVDRLIVADASENSSRQIFRIYEIEKPIDDLVTIRAEHISYLLSKIVVLPFTAGTAAAAFNGILTNVQWNTAARYFRSFPFTFWTDNTRAGEVNIESPTSVRSVLSGSEGSILDACHGEYEFDNFTVKLHANRGNDTEVVLRYGKNITDLTNTDDISNSYTGILAYWKGSLDETSATLDPENNVVTESVEETIFVTPSSQYSYNNVDPTHRTNYLNGKTLWVKNDDNNYGYPLSIPVDFSSIELNDYEAPELEQADGETDLAYATRLKNAKRVAEVTYKQYVLDELTKKANEYLNNNAGKVPTNTIKVSFVQLWNTEEYKDIAVLEHVNLCDTVMVYYPEFDISARSKVIKTEYNVLLDRYDSVELGDAVKNAADSIVSGMSDIEEEFNKQLIEGTRNIISSYKQAIEKATDLITGGLGGYLVINTNAAGQPNELLIMDSPSKVSARNVWRFNLNGLGHSHSGYAGPFDDVALTMDGRINAAMISTGVLDAAVIRAGILQDVKGWNVWDLESGEFRMASTTTIDGKPIATMDDIVVRNYMINTMFPDVSDDDNLPRIFGQPSATTIRARNYMTLTTATHGFRVTTTNPNSGVYYRPIIYFGPTSAANGSLNGLIPGLTYTLSFGYAIKLLSGSLPDSTTTYGFYASLTDDKNTTGTFAYDFGKKIIDISPANRKKTLSGTGSFTFTVPENATMLYITFFCNYGQDAGYGYGDFIQLTNIMLELGERVHKWTAAEEDYYDHGLGQEKVFNKLTNNGTVQGMFMEGGQLFINSDYVTSGTFKTADYETGALAVFMEGDSASIKGYYNRSLIGLIDTVNGANTSSAKMVLSAKNGIALLAPQLYVKATPSNWNPTSSQSQVYVTKSNEYLRYIFWHGSYWSDGKMTRLDSLNTAGIFVNGLYCGLSSSIWTGYNSPGSGGNGRIVWNGDSAFTVTDERAYSTTANI